MLYQQAINNRFRPINSMSINVQSLITTALFILFCAIYQIGHLFGFSFIVFLLLYIVWFFELWSEYKRHKKIITPKMIWIVCWQLIIVIARIDGIYQYITEWTNQLHYFVLLNTIAFYVAYELVFYISSHISGLGGFSRIYEKGVFFRKWINYERLFVFTSALLLIGIAGFFLTVLICGYIPALKGLIDSYRINFREKPTMILFNVARIGCAFVPLACQKTKSKLMKFLIYFLFFAYLLCGYLSGWRSNIFQGFIMYITGFFFAKKNQIDASSIIKRMLKYSLAIIFIFILFSYMRDIGKGNTIDRGVFSYVGFTLYMYIAPQFINLQTAMASYNPTNSFILSTEGIWSIFTDGSSIANYRPVQIVMKGGYNVSSYLLVPYLDYGLFGTIVWSIILALFAALAYSSYKKNNNIIWAIGFLAIMNAVIFTMHSGFLLTSATCYVWFFIILVFAYTCTRRETVLLNDFR